MLDRRIELIQPGTETRTPSGQVTHGAPVVHSIWAHAVDSGGSEHLDDASFTSTTFRTYTIRAASEFADLDERWCIREDGDEWNIRAVQRGLRIDAKIVIRAERGR